MACLEGFEPPTFWFVAKHSIQLSYRHKANNIIQHKFLLASIILSKKKAALQLILNNLGRRFGDLLQL